MTTPDAGVPVTLRATPTIYLDVTDLILWIRQHATVTGIQRVHLNYALHAIGHNVKFIMFYGRACRQVGLVDDAVIQHLGRMVSGQVTPDPATLYRLCPNARLRAWSDYSAKYEGKPLKHAWHSFASATAFHVVQWLYGRRMPAPSFAPGDVLLNVGRSWTIGGYVRQRNRGPAKPFAFAEAMHEPGSKTLLGRRYPQGGESEGTAAIANLCRHPSTARFIATKLVRHFVSDQPHPLDIDVIAGVYLDTDGDLGEVSLALLDLDGAFYGADRKIRSPQEFVIAMGRSFGLSTVDRKVVSALTSLRHTPWSPPSPAGYSDEVAEWGDPDGLLRRADLARMLTKRSRVRLPDAGAFAQDIMEVRDPALLNALLAEQSSAADQATLLFASPDFQWR